MSEVAQAAATTANKLLVELGTILKPVEDWGLQEIESIGSTLLTSVGAIFNGFIPAQQVVFLKAQAYFQAKHAAALAAGESELSAIETATTDTLGEFIQSEETAGADLIQSFITTLAASAKAQIPKIEADAATEAGQVEGQVAGAVVGDLAK